MLLEVACILPEALFVLPVVVVEYLLTATCCFIALFVCHIPSDVPIPSQPNDFPVLWPVRPEWRGVQLMALGKLVR